jgi:hypothetical protein
MPASNALSPSHRAGQKAVNRVHRRLVEAAQRGGELSSARPVGHAREQRFGERVVLRRNAALERVARLGETAADAVAELAGRGLRERDDEDRFDVVAASSSRRT